MPPSASPLSLVPLQKTYSDSTPSKPDDEKELKIVTPDGSSEPFKVFAHRLDEGKISGIDVLQKSPTQRLVARQLDTRDRALQSSGISLRIRGTYEGTDQGGRITTPDINIKTNKAAGNMGMLRGEYEADIANACTIDLQAIEKKYSSQLAAGTRPDLEEALALIRQHLPNIVEHFIIDTARERRVIGLDSSLVGFDGSKNFAGEMLMDKVRYQIRSPRDGIVEMTVNEGRRELELEPLHIACKFNTYAGCENHVCHGLDDFEEDYGLHFFRAALQETADQLGITIRDADLSKSGRGFAGCDQLSRMFSSLSRPGIELPPEALAQKPIAILVGAGRQINVPWELKAA